MFTGPSFKDSCDLVLRECAQREEEEHKYRSPSKFFLECIFSNKQNINYDVISLDTQILKLKGS